jgi:hypothetical protein
MIESESPERSQRSGPSEPFPWKKELPMKYHFGGFSASDGGLR